MTASSPTGAWQEASFGRYFLNTILITVRTVVITLVVTSCAGFVLARTRFPGRGFYLGLVSATLFLPHGYTIILLCAGTVITLAPIILLFVLLQRLFVNGLAGAVKQEEVLHACANCDRRNGNRAQVFTEGPVKRDGYDVVALCDPNSVRMAFHNRMLLAAGRRTAPQWPPGRFEEMLRVEQIELLIVTSVDATHDRYIEAALRSGVRVISEKPMTTDAAKATSILAAVRETGGSLAVAYNYRLIRCIAGCVRCWQRVRSGTFIRFTSSGCSTCRTARTTSVAGIATRRTRAD